MRTSTITLSHSLTHSAAAVSLLIPPGDYVCVFVPGHPLSRHHISGRLHTDRCAPPQEESSCLLWTCVFVRDEKITCESKKEEEEEIKKSFRLYSKDDTSDSLWRPTLTTYLMLPGPGVATPAGAAGLGCIRNAGCGEAPTAWALGSSLSSHF